MDDDGEERSYKSLGSRDGNDEDDDSSQRCAADRTKIIVKQFVRKSQQRRGSLIMEFVNKDASQNQTFSPIRFQKRNVM